MQAKHSDTVRVHYTGKFTDGEIFDSSIGREPLEFVLGQGMMIAGFEAAVLGMAVGDTRTIQIPPHEAYGNVNPNLVFEIPRQEIPADLPLELGMTLMMHMGDNDEMPVIVKDLTPELVLLDGNHPLAGEDLVFEIKMEFIKPRIITDNF